MLKVNKGAVLVTALFLLCLVPLGLTSCRNKTKVADTPAVAADIDSTSLLTLDKLIRENPKSPELFAKRAQLHADKLNYSQALNDITIALTLDSLNPAFYISQAEYYIFTGEPNSAKKGLQVCLRKFPDNLDARLKMAEIHLYLKEYGQAKLVLKEIIPINDDLAQIYFLQGMIALETGDTLGAIRNFQVTIEKDPEDYAAYIQAGKIYAVQDNDLAIQYFKSAIDMQPNMYEAHYFLALYYQEHSLIEEAQQEYEFISTKIDSTLADPYFNRGYIEMVYKGDFKEAANWFGKAIYWNPKYADAWYNRGFSYELDGQYNKAKADYQKAMDLEPNFPLAIKGLNRIEDGIPLKKNNNP